MSSQNAEESVNTAKGEELSVEWGKYRLRKWGEDTSQPELLELESRVLSLVPKLCLYITLGKAQKLDVLFSPIFPYDAKYMRESLDCGMVSNHSLFLRFNRQVITLEDNLLQYLSNIDLSNHFGVSCSVCEDGKWRVIATARFIRDQNNPTSAEWAAIVADKYHCNTIGSSLLLYITEMAALRGIKTMYAVVNPQNHPVLHWMRKLSAKLENRQDFRVWSFKVPLPCFWMESDPNRKLITQACNGQGSLPEFALNKIEKDFEFMRCM